MYSLNGILFLQKWSSRRIFLSSYIQIFELISMNNTFFLLFLFFAQHYCCCRSWHVIMQNHWNEMHYVRANVTNGFNWKDLCCLYLKCIHTQALHIPSRLKWIQKWIWWSFWLFTWLFMHALYICWTFFLSFSITPGKL